MKGFSAISLIVALSFGVVLGLSVFFLSKNTNPSTTPFSLLPNRHQQTASTENLINKELTSTAFDIVGYGQDLVCDWKLPLDGSQNPFHTGKLWTTAGKGKSTVTAIVNGVSIQANALYLNNTAYTWIIAGGQKTGMKFNPSTLEEVNRSMTIQQRQQAEQVRASMLFTCTAWIPDETKFILPADVAFEER